MTKKEQEEKILEITQEMVVALENPNLMMTRSQKEELEILNESLVFFLDKGDLIRGIREGERILEIINELEEGE